ncbi:hypothetical protein ACOSQ4_013958 [Xanthoceras sorbifolium]
MTERYSGVKKRSQTTSDSAADLKREETEESLQTSRGVVKEITAAIQSSGNDSIPASIAINGMFCSSPFSLSRCFSVYRQKWVLRMRSVFLFLFLVDLTLKKLKHMN